jgi:hypothetical protein
MIRVASLLFAVAVLAACGTDSPTVPDSGPTPSPLAKRVNQPVGPSASDEAAIAAFEAAGMNGAVVNHDVCYIVGPGFLNENGDLIGFGGLFPDECPQGFERVNPDGTIDNHMNGRGAFFLLLLEPFAFFGSEGSDVRWTWVVHEGGINILNINGTLSDGSRVRAHFTSGQNGAMNAKSGRLWVEGLGYILGSPGGK